MKVMNSLNKCDALTPSTIQVKQLHNLGKEHMFQLYLPQ